MRECVDAKARLAFLGWMCWSDLVFFALSSHWFCSFGEGVSVFFLSFLWLFALQIMGLGSGRWLVYIGTDGQGMDGWMDRMGGKMDLISVHGDSFHLFLQIEMTSQFNRSCWEGLVLSFNLGTNGLYVCDQQLHSTFIQAIIQSKDYQRSLHCIRVSTSIGSMTLNQIHPLLYLYM
jgi:hypothetical protein